MTENKVRMTSRLLAGLPVLWQARVRQILYFVEGALGLYNVKYPVTLRRRDGHWSVRSGDETIAIAFPNRLGFYKFGVSSRFEHLLNQFGAGVHGPISLNDGDIVIDIGANIGEFGLACAERGCSVFAFEPDPDVQSALRANTTDVAAVSVFPIALWHCDDMLTFYRKGATADSSLIDNGSAVKINIAARRLDSIEGIAAAGPIQLLKCDAEGAEPEVLEGAAGLLERVRWVAIDCGPERGMAGERTEIPCRKILERAGFEIIEARRGGREVMLARNLRFSSVKS